MSEGGLPQNGGHLVLLRSTAVMMIMVSKYMYILIKQQILGVYGIHTGKNCPLVASYCCTRETSIYIYVFIFSKIDTPTP